MNRIRLHVQGNLACFTRPETKVERVSYDVMTPSAARGILEAIHWKPAIRWVIDRIHVLRPIRTTSIMRNEVKSRISAGALEPRDTTQDRTQRSMQALFDVGYVIEAHVEMTAKASEQDNLTKHLEMFRRRAARGQCFQQPALGMREMIASFRLIDDAEPLPPAIDETRDLGLMVWDIDYAQPKAPGMFFRARLERGVVNVPQPGSAEVLR